LPELSAEPISESMLVNDVAPELLDVLLDEALLVVSSRLVSES